MLTHDTASDAGADDEGVIAGLALYEDGSVTTFAAVEGSEEDLGVAMVGLATAE